MKKRYKTTQAYCLNLRIFYNKTTLFASKNCKNLQVNPLKKFKLNYYKKNNNLIMKKLNNMLVNKRIPFFYKKSRNIILQKYYKLPMKNLNVNFKQNLNVNIKQMLTSKKKWNMCKNLINKKNLHFFKNPNIPIFENLIFSIIRQKKGDICKRINTKNLNKFQKKYNIQITDNLFYEIKYNIFIILIILSILDAFKDLGNKMLNFGKKFLTGAKEIKQEIKKIDSPNAIKSLLKNTEENAGNIKPLIETAENLENNIKSLENQQNNILNDINKQNSGVSWKILHNPIQYYGPVKPHTDEFDIWVITPSKENAIDNEDMDKVRTNVYDTVKKSTAHAILGHVPVCTHCPNKLDSSLCTRKCYLAEIYIARHGDEKVDLLTNTYAWKNIINHADRGKPFKAANTDFNDNPRPQKLQSLYDKNGKPVTISDYDHTKIYRVPKHMEKDVLDSIARHKRLQQEKKLDKEEHED